MLQKSTLDKLTLNNSLLCSFMNTQILFTALANNSAELENHPASANLLEAPIPPIWFMTAMTKKKIFLKKVLDHHQNVIICSLCH